MILCGDVRTRKVDEQTPDGAKKKWQGLLIVKIHQSTNLAAKSAEVREEGI